MTSKGNILSFKDAKKRIDRSRPSVVSSKTKLQNPNTSLRASKLSSSKSNFRAPSEDIRRPSVRDRTYFISDTSRFSGNGRSDLRGSTFLGRSTQSDLRSIKPQAEKVSGTTRDRSQSPADSSFRRPQTRSKSTKKKADKNYMKQFGRAAQAVEDKGPRAAVFKGEMGKKHKKANKMQGSRSTRGSSKAASETRFSLKRSPKTLTSLALALGLVLSIVFLYPVAQQYYLALRNYDQVYAEYLVVEQRNDEIRAEIEKLSNSEGIEDRLREEYGWVKEGEHLVRVKGLETKEAEVNYVKSIPSGSVAPGGSWYTPLLDALFGYSHEEA